MVFVFEIFMREYIFYTTEGYTEAPNQDYRVENCQLLGTAFGKNQNDALDSLIEENKWIIDAGFSRDKISYRLLAPAEP